MIPTRPSRPRDGVLVAAADRPVLVAAPPLVEVVEATPEGVHLVAAPRPFDLGYRVEKEIPEGATILEMLHSAGLNGDVNARVMLDAWLVPRALWARVKPKKDHVVTVRVIPEGGGEGTKNVYRALIILAFVVIGLVAGYFLGPAAGFATTAAGVSLAASIGASVGAAVGGVVGSLVANPLVPPATI
jgi:hypothetical protein